MRRLTTICITLLATSCVITDVGNPVEKEQALEVSFSASDGRETSDGSRVEQAWLWLGPMRWEAGPDCDRVVSSAAPGAAGWGLDRRPSVVAVEMPCAVELTLEPAGTERLDEAEHAELVNHSLYFAGVTPAGNSFRVRTSQALEFRATTPGLELADGGTLRLAVDIDTVLDGLDWPEQEAGASIRVDDEHETDLRDEIIGRLEASLSLEATSGPRFELVSGQEDER